MVFASFAVGNELAANPGTVVHLKVDSTPTLGTDYNVIAETRKGDPNNVVMVGAHLDSVPAGPGINDNGSGTAAILETALQMVETSRRRTRSGSPSGPPRRSVCSGPTSTSRGLTAAERDSQAVPQLRHGRLAELRPTALRRRRLRRDRRTGRAARLGADREAIESFFTSRDLAAVGTDFDGRSDYGPFIAAGIPAGGIFTGAEGIKTPAEAALFGGTAGVAYDICYHQACDTIANPNLTALDVNADAIADSTARYAFNLTAIP